MLSGNAGYRLKSCWQADCLSPGKAMHFSRHPKTKGGQGMTHGNAKTRGGQGKAQGKAITRVGSRVAGGGGGLPPLGKPRPPDAGCQGTLLSRPLGQFLAIWPRLLEKTLPVGNARKKDRNAPESKCYLKPSRKAKHGSIGQSKTLSGNSWPFGLGYPRKQIPSVMLRKTTEIPKKTRPVGNARKEHRKALEMACYCDRVWQGETRFSLPFGLGYANRYRPPPSHPRRGKLAHRVTAKKLLDNGQPGCRAMLGGGGLPPLGKPRPADAGCQGTLLSRPLGQFLAIWPRLLEKTLPVGNARKIDRNAPESKCYLKPSRKAKHGSIGQSKTLSGNSWPLGLGYSLKHCPSVMLEKNTEIPPRQIVVVTGPVGQGMTLSGKETLYRANAGRLALETSKKMTCL
ncbi:hypothetical protein RHSIM_Rhsim13G0130300 [Rhododendron simsii]|uniref:Uncharacterized protein n=1 Tax=Rhododendron simsii TaxID=118357 RepID=A0A834L804_RHOSS|nr:hypothetical protein RHSIM_Rhsim13G0130300 [Rhododendron simsii]